jgi:hypothetical protein
MLTVKRREELQTYIYEKSAAIAIPSPKNNNLMNEYSLKNSVFDPFKSSPPNNFLEKLKSRMSIYETLEIKSAMRDSE